MYDKYKNFNIHIKRKKIKNLLLIGGGGTSATFYALGAVKCLIDNDLFDFDVISAVSGATFLTHFIELAMHFNYYKKHNWFNIYVRDILYKFIEENIFHKLLVNKFDFTYVFNSYFDFILKPFNKTIKNNPNIKTKFHFNSIDFYKQNVEFDHPDIYDINNNVKIDNWYIYRLLRSVMPMFFYNNKVSLDAGICDLNGFSILTKYDPENVIVISPVSNIKKDKYTPHNNIKFIRRISGTVFETSYKAVDDMAKIILQDKNVLFCNMSNTLTKSKDKYHKNLLDDYYNDITHFKTCLVGVIFSNTKLLKIMENEGYIQMYYSLKQEHRNIKFKIPNPDVYNENVRKIYNDFKNSNIIFDIFKDFLSKK